MNFKLMVFCGLFFASLNLIAWDKDGSPIATGPGDQVWPDVCWDGQEFWVVWQNNVDSTIYGARVDSAGELIDPNPIQYPRLSGYTHYWPSVAFGDTILCIAFQSLKYDTFMLGDIAKVVSVRFRPDGSMIDTESCFLGYSSFLCPPTQSPQVIFGKDHFICFMTYTIYEMQFEEYRKVYVRSSYNDTSMVIWNSHQWESGITGIWDGDRILTAFTGYNYYAVREEDTVFGLFLQDNLQVQKPELFEIRTPGDFPPGTFSTSFSSKDKEIAFGESLFLFVTATDDGPIWFDILGMDGLPIKSSPTLVDLPGVHPAVIWNGEDFIVVCENGKDLSGLIINTQGDIKKIGYVARQSYHEKNPSLAFGSGKILLVWADNRNGDFDIYGMFIDSLSIGVGEKVEPLQNDNPLLAAFPNPFCKTMQIRCEYSVASSEGMTLKIYDVTGKLVKSFNLTIHQSPITSIVWDGSDDAGKLTSPGVYFCRLETKDYQVTQKIVRVE